MKTGVEICVKTGVQTRVKKGCGQRQDIAPAPLLSACARRALPLPPRASSAAHPAHRAPSGQGQGQGGYQGLCGCQGHGGSQGQGVYQGHGGYQGKGGYLGQGES